MFEYVIKKSRRKTVSIHIDTNGEVIVRAPLFASDSSIRNIVEENAAEIEKRLEELEEKRETIKEAGGKLSERELKDLTIRASEIIPDRVSYYASAIGVEYGKITIRHQKTRWGSCTSKGDLNFNCLLMLAPVEVLDSVIVHELCHIKYMDHSKKYYEEVLKYYPEYKKWNKWLKKNGETLVMMLPDR